MDDNSRMFIVSKCRRRLLKLGVIFDKKYAIITVEYAYKVALKYGVNNNEETKQKVILMRKIESFVEERC